MREEISEQNFNFMFCFRGFTAHHRDGCQVTTGPREMYLHESVTA